MMTSKMPDNLKRRCHECRKPSSQSDEEEIERLREWLDKDKAWAQNLMAQVYRDGTQSIKQSYVMARLLFEKAAKQGDANAMHDLGVLYRNGKGVVQSFTKAAEYFTMAAEQGDLDAMHNLAHLYQEGQGVAQSYTKATELYTMAAEQGHVDAMTSVGVLYIQGKGVDQSNEVAREWWTKAANEGQEGALINLKQLDDQEGKPSTAIKDELYASLMAATQGVVRAMVHLGTMYNQGRGVVQSTMKARKWWTKAAHEGDQGAIRNLKKLDELKRRSTTTASSPRPVCCSSCNIPQPSTRKFCRCNGCRSVQYCNKECQRAHWSPGGHKQECKRLKKKKEKKKKSSSSQNKKSKST